jgi:hypothetical protein
MTTLSCAAVRNHGAEAGGGALREARRYRTLFETMTEGFALGEVIFDEWKGFRSLLSGLTRN